MIAPSLWLVVDPKTPGFWGWPFLGGFLNAVGWNLTVIALGLLIRYVSNVIKNASAYLFNLKSQHTVISNELIDKKIIFYKDLSLFLNIISYTIIGIATFYILFNTIPVKLTSRLPVYFGLLTVGALISVFTIILISKFLQTTEEYAKQKIKNLVSFIFRVRNYHYPNVASKALYAEIHDKAIASDDSVEDNTYEFDEDLITTLEKIPPKSKKIE